MARVKGALRETKPALKAQDLYNRQLEQQQKQAGAMEQISARGDEAQELQRQRFDLLARQDMSPRDKQMALDALNRQIAVAQTRGSYGVGARARYDKFAGMDERPGSPTYGRSGTWYINRATQEREFIPAGVTAATKGKEEAKGAAMVAYNAIRQLRKELPAPEGWVEAGITGIGREIGARTQANPVANRYKASIRGFVPLMARALGHVGVLTELDIERTEALFSGLGATAETDRLSDEMMRGIMTGQVPFMFQGGGKPIGYIDEEGNFTLMGGGGTTPVSPRQPSARASRSRR